MKATKRYVNIFRGVRLPWISMLVLLTVSVIEVTLGLASVELTASIIDASQNAIDGQRLVRYAVNLGLTVVATVLETYYGGLVDQKIGAGVRVKIWDKLMRLPLCYYDTESANDLVSRVTSDPGSASTYITVGISCITTVYATVTAFTQLFKFHTGLATWSLLIIPCTVGIGAIYSILSYHSSLLGTRASAKTVGYMTEHVHNLRLIRALGTEGVEKDKSRAIFKRQYWTDLYSQSTVGYIAISIQALGCLSLAISFVAGGRMVAEGTLSVGTLIVFYGFSSMVSIHLSNLFMAFGSIVGANGALKKVSQLLEQADETGGGQAVEGEEDIVLENVSFAYKDVPVLSDISCRLPCGKVTAIVGTNGAGKSTVLKLLERMYKPDSGRILFGDRDVEDYSLESWRRALAIVAQDTPLMSGTVRENLTYGLDREVSDEELYEAAKLANAYDFITETPGGLDAEVGPGGTNFSGGQRQCLAIARAIVRAPRYLLLDEATSNLDAKCEDEVSTALDRLMEGRTTVMIAHSFRATLAADQVIVMDNGHIVGMGTPEELLRTNAYYQTFARRGEKEAV